MKNENILRSNIIGKQKNNKKETKHMTTFNNKETYLAYRSNWKAEYKQLSEDIRDLKLDIKDAQRNNDFTGRPQYSLYKLRKQATAMLAELKEAKQEAQRQYLASKQELVTA